MGQKKFQQLDLKDSFLFAAALEDPETCRLVLEMIMGRPIGPVKVKVERSILFSKDFRYVRFDVYASDVTNVSYDMEMQNSHKKELPKRARFHQAEMDATFLKPGQGFDELPPSYVMFICTYDPFDAGLYRYTYEERCEETGECLGDGTCKIYLNTKGTNALDVPQELIHFLNYVEASTDACVEETGDEKVRKLHQRVKTLKKSRRLEEAYMTMEELLADREAEGEAKGRAEGEAKGRQQMLDLVTLMVRDGMAEEIPRLSGDEEFCKSMLERYHLE